MQIARVSPTEHSEFLDLVNAEIRPDRAKTNAWDDFPLILGADNLSGMLAIRDSNGRIAAGLACLIRSFRTSWGNLQIGGLGSVVTRPDCRGRGYSTALQNEMIAELRRKKVPLAVLWTDQPEIYSGRGFTAAGWETHLDLRSAELGPAPTRGYREYRESDVAAVETLYTSHPYFTVRESGDSRKLYGMPGTRGLVAVDDQDRPRAAIFCGKGADFPEYVAEWSGPPNRILPLLAVARHRGWAQQLIAPAGTQEMVRELTHRGAAGCAMTSGQWLVTDPELLTAAGAETGGNGDPVPVLGTVAPDGSIRQGPLQIAVWGFDSV